jgi:hypothetical protein
MLGVSLWPLATRRMTSELVCVSGSSTRNDCGLPFRGGPNQSTEISGGLHYRYDWQEAA